jgi:hypothetical protein
MLATTGKLWPTTSSIDGLHKHPRRLRLPGEPRFVFFFWVGVMSNDPPRADLSKLVLN